MTEAELKLLRALQPEIVKRMGAERLADLIWCETCELLVTWEGHQYPDCEYLRIPLAIDPENPERGLWGMIEGMIGMWKVEEGWVVETRSTLYRAEATSYLALLKALAAQWGSEVPND